MSSDKLVRVEVAHRFAVGLREGYDYITNLDNWHAYWPGLVRIDPDSRWRAPGDLTRIALRLLGRETEMTMVLARMEPYRLVEYMSEQSGLPQARHERHFADDGEAALVYRAVVEYVPRSGLRGLFDRVVFRRAVERALRTTVANLDTRFAARAPRPQRQAPARCRPGRNRRGERGVDRVEVDGLHIAYERVGSGPALVLLHGYVGDGPTTWRRQLDGLSDEFTVVAWDAPGAGRSTDPPEGFGLDGYADCLAGFLEKSGLGAACVAGLSFGGILALALQRRHSASSSALILASAYAGWAGSLPPEDAEQRLRQALALADGTPEAFAAALLPTMFAKPMPRKTVDDFRASMQAFHPRGFRAMARASAEDARDVLPHVNVPTLLVYGDRDVRAPRTVAEALHAAISGSRLLVLPDAGHVCNVEAPDEFNMAARDFLHESCS